MNIPEILGSQTSIVGGIVVASSADHDTEHRDGVSSLPQPHGAVGGEQLDRGVVFVREVRSVLVRKDPGRQAGDGAADEIRLGWRRGDVVC